MTTSDPRLQIVTMNRKAREEWERKQAEEEKLRKLNEVSTPLHMKYLFPDV